MQKIWQVAERLDPDVWQHILLSRELTDSESQQRFFSPSLENLTSPMDWPDMDKAVERIWRAIEAQEPMVVWGDFDADGVTSTAILWETLHQLGAKVLPYIPNRDAEGHGFSQEGMRELADRGTKLIVTVDHGVTAFEDIATAGEMGMEVIVTDHHEPMKSAQRPASSVQRPENDQAHELQTMSYEQESYCFPNCVAVVHPFRLTQPQKHAGCGVAYMVAYAVWLARPDSRQVGRSASGESRVSSLEYREKNAKRGVLNSSFKTRNSKLETRSLELATSQSDSLSLRQEFAQSRIELAALGTIADLMPLTDDNRILATEGLKALAKTKRAGLRQMYGLAGVAPAETMSVYEVGFVVAPRLNAPGRLGDALESLRLLCVKDAGRAMDLAGMLDDLNTERQELLKRVVKEASTELEAHGDLGAYVLQNEGWPAGVCGLAAGKLVEQVYRPVVVMERQGEMARGSARSIRGFDITAALTEIKDLLERFGGHAMAAGFVCKADDVPEVERRLSEMVLSQLSEEELVPQLRIDAAVDLSEVSERLCAQLKKLEPCGMGNPQPVFVSRGVEVLECRVIGKDSKHLKLKLDRNVPIKQKNELDRGKWYASKTAEVIKEYSYPIDAVAFGFGDMAAKLQRGILVDVVFTLEENVWNGRASLQLKVKDLQVVEASEV